MLTENDLLQSYFTEKDIQGMTHNEFQVAMIGLIEGGLIEMEIKNGVRYYKPTQLLIQAKSHEDSDPKQQS